MALFRSLARHREFMGNVATMMSGRTIAAAVALFTMPIVARLFTPEDFGVAAVFASISGLAATISSLRYELAVVLPERESAAQLLLAFTYRVLLCFCLAMLLLIAAYELSDATIAPLDLLGYWIWLLPLSVLFTGAIAVQESWLTRQKSFKAASTALVVGNASTSAVRIALGAISGSSVWGLIWGYLLGSFLRCSVQQYASGRASNRAIFRRISWRDMRHIARAYADFPRLNAPAGLIYSLGQNIPILLFGAMFSPAVVGYYAMAFRLTEVPISIVANSIRKVFLQKSAEIMLRHGSLLRAFLLTVGGLALLGVLPALILAFAGKTVLVWLLGERWAIAGSYVGIMAPFLLMQWIASPTGPVFIVLRRQAAWLQAQAAMTAMKVMAIAAAYLVSADAELTLKLFIAAAVIGYIGEIGLAILVISRHVPESESRGGSGEDLGD